MAYDIFKRREVPGQWTMGAGGTPLRSRAIQAERKLRKEATDLSKEIEREVLSTAAIGVARRRANTLTPEDEAGFKAFYVSWKDWREKHIDSGAPIPKDAVATLGRFRAQNVEWTRRLTSVPNAPVVVPPPVAAPPPPVAKAEEKSSPLPWILAMGGIALLGLGLSGGRS